ncbi:MAG TPA: hypothetical protein VFP84_40590 [Kofleriaceae bacterium]|nr:hypothetical protein [Kofleriaceae bacterium]
MLLVSAVLVSCVVACGSGAGETGVDAGTSDPCAAVTDTPAGSTFIAVDTSWRNFRTWPSVHSDGPVDDGTFPPEVLGPRTQYINCKPAAGSTEFPVGTMIAEIRESGKIFAAAKRGGGFNSTGAVNWEWFELVIDDTNQVAPVHIFWRGFGPPIGDTYGGDVTGGCNACHKACGSSNDYACSPKLQLPTLF